MQPKYSTNLLLLLLDSCSCAFSELGRNTRGRTGQCFKRNPRVRTPSLQSPPQSQQELAGHCLTVTSAPRGRSPYLALQLVSFLGTAEPQVFGQGSVLGERASVVLVAGQGLSLLGMHQGDHVQWQMELRL